MRSRWTGEAHNQQNIDLHNCKTLIVFYPLRRIAKTKHEEHFLTRTTLISCYISHRRVYVHLIYRPVTTRPTLSFPPHTDCLSSDERQYSLVHATPIQTEKRREGGERVANRHLTLQHNSASECFLSIDTVNSTVWLITELIVECICA